jgi:cell wall-associated NlpC family hydrolase
VARRPKRSPRSNPSTRSSRLLLAALTAVAVSSGTLVTATITPAHADIADQITAVQARLDTLNAAAGAAAERYNAGRIRLVKAQRDATAAQRKAQQESAAVQALRAQAGQFAAQVYRGGSGGMGMQVLQSAEGPQALLDGLGALNHVARTQADALSRLATARHRQAQAADTAKKAAAEQRASVAALEADRATVVRSATQAGQLLRQLQVKQAALVKAAADAAARKAAQERAALLASQAAANEDALAAFNDSRSQAPAASSAPPRQYSGNAAQIAVRVAQDQLGKPYVWGASGPGAYDCSGLTMYAYAAAGISLPHYTGAQWNSGRHVSQSELRPGDLIFFHSDLHHMGMYIGGGQLIHAPRSGDVVRIVSLSGWFQDKYAGAVRIAG